MPMGVTLDPAEAKKIASRLNFTLKDFWLRGRGDVRIGELLFAGHSYLILEGAGSDVEVGSQDIVAHLKFDRANTFVVDDLNYRTSDTVKKAGLGDE
ncbi:hypothetical protein JYT83_00505 [bacterium AH-315-F18]|nr:hypothetical protein [bacterium AH-315-F18]